MTASINTIKGIKMKYAIPTIVAITLTVIGFIAYKAESQTVTSNAIQQQPQREQYVAPEWVINDKGQRCIKQGTTVTCG